MENGHEKQIVLSSIVQLKWNECYVPLWKEVLSLQTSCTFSVVFTLSARTPWHGHFSQFIEICVRSGLFAPLNFLNGSLNCAAATEWEWEQIFNDSHMGHSWAL